MVDRTNSVIEEARRSEEYWQQSFSHPLASELTGVPGMFFVHRSNTYTAVYTVRAQAKSRTSEVVLKTLVQPVPLWQRKHMAAVEAKNKHKPTPTHTSTRTPSAHDHLECGSAK